MNVQRLPVTRAAGSILTISPSILSGLVAAIVVTWIATLWLMGGMAARPGTSLGEFGWFVGSWVVMMAAMMLPAELRFALVFAQFADEGPRSPLSPAVHTWLFLGGYLVSWTGYGVLAYVADWVVRATVPHVVTWEAYGPLLTGMVIAAAGVYQFSSLKRACLRHCVSPASFFMQRWRAGAFGALRMGMEHGLFCIGCCWGLMVVLFMMGVMSLLWMVLLAGVMFAEKMLPWGPRMTRTLAIVLIALGLWVAAAPRTAPFLTQPGVRHQHQP